MNGPQRSRNRALRLGPRRPVGAAVFGVLAVGAFAPGAYAASLAVVTEPFLDGVHADGDSAAPLDG